MGASPANALSRAHALTRRALFPIRGDKWLHLGFIAFLAEIAQGGASFQPPFPGSSGGASPQSIRDVLNDVQRQLAEHWFWIAVFGSIAAVVAAAVAGTLLWISSRGKLMFTESVIHDRFAVSEPWQRLREPAWDVFKVRLWIGLAFGLLSLLVVAAAALVAWPDLSAVRFGSSAIAGLLLLFALIPLSAPALLFLALLDDFLIPIVYLDGVSVREAWRVFRARLLPGNAGPIALFYVAKLVLGFAIASAVLVLTCITCCLAALPYVSSVVFLPVHVFLRAFSLYFLEELGKPVFPPETAPHDAAPAYHFPAGGGG